MEASNTSSPRLRRLLLAGLPLLLVLVWVAAGFHRVEPGDLTVVEGTILRLAPRAPEPGLRWGPPLLSRTVRYPGNLDLEWTAPSATTPEGSRLRASARLEARLEPEGLLEFHRILGRAWRERLEGELERQIGDALRQVPDPLGHPDEVERYVAQRLAGLLDGAGAHLEELELRLTTPDLAQARAEAASRVLLVGFDGFDWRIARPLMEEGRMPHLRALVERGAWGRLRTLSPILSPVIWTSMATGVEPQRHGILDFVAPGPEGRPIPVTSNLRRVPAFWNMLSEAGLTVGTVAWWATWPAEPVNGAQVSDRLAYTLFGLDRGEGPPTVALTHPPALAAELEPRKVEPTDITVAEVRRFLDLPGGRFPRDPDDLERIDEMRRSLASARTYEAAALHLLETRSFHLFAVYFEAPDVFSHLFMPFRPPKRDSVSAERFGMYRRAVDEIYAYHDEILGRLLERVDLEETHVLVVSDHGFRSDAHRPAGDARIGHGQAADWHRKFGVLALAGPAVRRGVRVREAGILDILPTIMALLGRPVAEDWPGQVLRPALEPSFLVDHPVASIPTYGERGDGGDRRAVGSSVDQAVMEKLVALGYVDASLATAGGEGDDGAADGASPGPSGGPPAGGLTGPMSLNNEGSSLMAAGRLAEAEERFRRALEEQPGFRGARANLGIVLYLQGRYEEAREELEKARQGAPDRPGVLTFLANAQARLGALDEAERLLRRALELDPGHVEASNSLGLLLEERGRRQEAEEFYRKAVETDPDYALSWNNLGNLARAIGHPEEAEEHYRRAIEADPAFIGSYNNLGLLLQERGELPQAVDLYREALERVPGHPEVRNNLATLYHQLGRYDEAIQEYQALIRERPGYAEAYNNLGVLYGEIGDREAEERQYRRALEVRPDYVDARHNLGLALLRSGRTEEAERELHRVLEQDPTNLGALRNLAILELRRGRPDEGLPLVGRALERAPADAGLHTLEAVLLEEAGRTGESCQALARSLRLDPDQQEALEMSDRLGCGP